MTIPTGTYRFGDRCQTPETRPTQGRCPEHSPEAAAGIAAVQAYWKAQKAKPRPFTIKTPKKEIAE